MEDLIELYLFKNRQCPLPSVGLLQVMDNHSVALYSEGKIEAPVPIIKLLDSSLPAHDLIAFIAREKNISTVEAAALLKQYCSRLQAMDAYSETKLPHTGKFYVNSDGNLVFKTKEIPGSFHPRVSAERVIHPAASHSMVVGDKETTTTEMAAYYSEPGSGPKDKWWIWASCLAIVAAGILIFYFNGPHRTPGFGNTQQIEVSPLTETYKIVE